MRELYIYYRVDDAHVAAARRAVEAMHDRLRQAHPGLVARLLTRAGDGSAPQTWMETYALPGSTGGVDADLEAGIEAGGRKLGASRRGLAPCRGVHRHRRRLTQRPRAQSARSISTWAMPVSSNSGPRRTKPARS